MKLKGLLKGSKGLLSSVSGSSSKEKQANHKSRAAYKDQVKKLKNLFPKRKNKHKHRSNAAKERDEEGGGEADSESEKDSYVDSPPRKQKKPKKKGRAKRGQRFQEDDIEAGDENHQAKTSRSRSEPGKPNRIGIKYQVICTLLTIEIVLSLVGFLLIGVVEMVGGAYGWTQLAPAVTTLLVFQGLGASSTLVSAIYLITQLGLIKGRALESTTPFVPQGISLALTFIAFCIALSQLNGLVDVFGHSYLRLLQVYRTHESEKRTVDRIQIEFGCCGIHSYEDWFKVASLHSLGNHYVPFSCCSIQVLRPCVHEGLPRISDLQAELSVYEQGCKEPMEVYYKVTLRWTTFVLTTLLLSQVFLMALLMIIRNSGQKGRRRDEEA